MDEDLFSSTTIPSLDPLTHIQTLHFDISILRDKIHNVQNLICSLLSAEEPDANALIAPTASAAIHDMIVVASSLLINLQQFSFCSPAPQKDHSTRAATASLPTHDVVEMDACALLAKYTHYCHVCGKGFRRDANLRMHMRAHGDAYKTREALSKAGGVSHNNKFSCPEEGCRWNWKHAKFQPLKSVACAKNHYKRSHCPKLYVCSRCGKKEFSVLSDLRTHEKHCGNPRWRCSCATTFSRKDKLLSHVGLFLGLGHHVQVAEGAAIEEVGNQKNLPLIGEIEGVRRSRLEHGVYIYTNKIS